MKHLGIIFAGGTGQRMNAGAMPKQFLELHGKPILIYTLEKFQRHPKIDGIILVCLDSWIDYCKELVDRFHISKVMKIVAGGQSGQESIFNGLHTAFSMIDENCVVLIHDGVRPLINEKTITDNISTVIQKGSAITVAPAIETIVVKNNDGALGDILDRSQCQVAKAPQSFYLSDIYNAHLKAREEKRFDFIDSASLMKYYNYRLYTVEGPSENIKITTPADFYIFRAILDARENSQIMGL